VTDLTNCPYCGEEIKLGAVKCKHCKTELEKKEATIHWDGGSYSGQVISGVPSGKGKWKHEDGRLYEGEWKAGQKDGEGTLIYKSGAVYSGTWEQNELIEVKRNEQASRKYEKPQQTYQTITQPTPEATVTTHQATVNKIEKLEKAGKTMQAVGCWLTLFVTIPILIIFILLIGGC
jgi:hypothetical protein